MIKFFVYVVAILTTVMAWGDEKKNLTSVPVSTVLDQSAQYTEDKLSLELFSYEEYAYSQSRKTEVGDQMKLISRFRYQVNDYAWMSLGFRTDPDVDRRDNKTSDFELRAGYNFEKLTAQVDFSLNTSDSDGGISFGLDLDSENTFLRYKFTDSWQLTFFPFNFDGAVGVEFETDDVTRIYFIDGTPSNITLEPDPNDPAERVVEKTVPGFELRYSEIKSKKKFRNFYLGLGVATYEFPNDPNFDITQTAAGNTWARRETFGYKFGGVSRSRNSFSSFQYVGHTEDKETGSLLKSAASIYNLSNLRGGLVLEAEVTASEGGEQPYRIDNSENWFDTSDPILAQTSQRVYKDIAGERQNWLGEWGAAASVKLGLRKRGFTPYLSYKFQDENFVFRGRESAHELRTTNLSESHGGLHRIGLGSYIYRGNFIINPRFEYLIAKNDVFSDNALITDFDPTAVFTDNDYVFFINVAYFFDKRTGPRTFRL